MESRWAAAVEIKYSSVGAEMEILFNIEPPLRQSLHCE